MGFLIFGNILVICVSNPSSAINLYTNHGDSGIIIFEEDPPIEADCWTLMLKEEGTRVLECNKPCCYRVDYKPYYPYNPNGKCVAQDTVPEFETRKVPTLFSDDELWKNCSNPE